MMIYGISMIYDMIDVIIRWLMFINNDIMIDMIIDN
jgi:hypothetical protein